MVVQNLPNLTARKTTLYLITKMSTKECLFMSGGIVCKYVNLFVMTAPVVDELRTTPLSNAML